jgi:hypothetical protein
MKHSAIYGLCVFIIAAASHADRFRATGNTDEDHRAKPHAQGEVEVTFDTLPTRMRFDLPGHILMYTENGIPYMNGATETYIPGEGVHEGSS